MTKPDPGAAPPEAAPPNPAEDAPAEDAPEAAPADDAPQPPEGAPVEDAAKDDPGSDGAEPGDPAAEIAELKDRLLRAVAETENLRKRAAREREEAARYAIAGFARDVLGVADDMARALGGPPESAREAPDAKALVEGLELTRRNLDAALERHGIARIDPAGEPFDPNLHEAMFEVDAPGAAPGSVVQVVEAGYRIHDRLLRPARVGVARRAAPPEEEPEKTDGGGGGGREGEPPP